MPGRLRGVTRPHGGNREKILDTALRLFNEQSTGPVSTNHIAKEAGVSPGNLYYHFRNKQELIRELYSRQVDEFAPLWQEMQSSRQVFVSLVELLYRGFEITWRYRFFAREQSSLMQQDPWLKEKLRWVYETRSVLVPPLMDAARKEGIVDLPDDDGLIDDINRLIWMVTYYWLSFFDLESDEPPENGFLEGTRLCLRTVEPYLREDVRREMFDRLGELSRHRAD